MVFIKTDEEIEFIRKSNQLVGKTLAEVARLMKPGTSTKKIDELAEEFIRDNGAEPAFKGYNGFPNTLCISINDQVVHGIPKGNEIKDGDIVSVDCGTILNGYYGDSAYTFEIGEVDENIKFLLKVTKEALYKGIEKAIIGNRVGDISFAIQEHIESFGFSAVRELVGHGVGIELHESPEVPNFGKRGRGMKLQRGIVIAIEPMINMGKKEIKQSRDGWTISTIDGKPSAHFEHTIAVDKDKADILSTFEYIEEILKNN